MLKLHDFCNRAARPEHPDQRTFLIAIGVASEHAERAARATITALQSTATQADTPIDLTSFDPAQDPPDYLRHPGVQRFFGPRRSWRGPGSDTHQ